MKATRKEDKQKRAMMAGILKEFQKTMVDYCLTTECGSQYRRGTEVIEELLKIEETSSNLHKELQAHIHLMEKGECIFVVAGMYMYPYWFLSSLLLSDGCLDIYFFVICI